MRSKTMPLGIDIGTNRIRVALSERTAGDDVRLRAVASRDIPEDVRETPALIAAILEETIGELGTRERRCVTSLGGSDAALKVVRFPKMSWSERLSAARFEAQRFAGPHSNFKDSVVRVHRTAFGDDTFMVAVAPKERIRARVAIAKLARLNHAAIDHDAVALRRSHSLVDAILDIGSERSTLHCYGQYPIRSHHCAVGGAEVTRGISRDLFIDGGSAERRKRILGVAGAGTRERGLLVAECAKLIAAARTGSQIDRIALVGNGSRLPGFAAELERASGANVELPVPVIMQSSEYPDDVLRTAAPDWALAVALTTWSVK